jgi:hypothetical protein
LAPANMKPNFELGTVVRARGTVVRARGTVVRAPLN